MANRIDVNERTCVHVYETNVKINQLKAMAKDGFDYDSIFITKEELLQLAEQIKEEQNNG
ncbi:hypothetical protein TAFFO16_279 [Bacillus phage Taffo16]|uniref:Uncharacterized protein n=1 Tax=Bacillus phage Taffo16 TaxID=2030094 RepID=A0A249XVR8_9CAUD|nr:hypothetical protein TAFFO16_279 [Bacillus phage Taffo16]ULF48905.1 hypothetical protein [Bacillus phage BillyBob]